MFGFQTLACLHDIPVVRSSTDKLQNVYIKAKDKSVLIRFPCNVAETIADKSLKLAVTVTNPLVKPISGHVRAIDEFAVEKFHQIEAKYPLINTPAEKVMNTLNKKTEPVRHVINIVKDTITSIIQHGKHTVSNVADTIYTFCETHVPGKTISTDRYDFARRTTLLWERITSTLTYPVLYLLTWFRLLIVSFLLKFKQINDVILNQIQQKPFFAILSQRLFIYTGGIIDYLTNLIRPNEYTDNKSQQQTRTIQNKQFISRPTLKPGAFVNTNQIIGTTKQDTIITRTGSNIDDRQQSPLENDIDKLHAKIHPTDIEHLYSHLSSNIHPNVDNDESLSDDQ